MPCTTNAKFVTRKIVLKRRKGGPDKFSQYNTFPRKKVYRAIKIRHTEKYIRWREQTGGYIGSPLYIPPSILDIGVSPLYPIISPYPPDIRCGATIFPAFQRSLPVISLPLPPIASRLCSLLFSLLRWGVRPSRLWQREGRSLNYRLVYRMTLSIA